MLGGHQYVRRPLYTDETSRDWIWAVSCLTRDQDHWSHLFDVMRTDGWKIWLCHRAPQITLDHHFKIMFPFRRRSPFDPAHCCLRQNQPAWCSACLCNAFLPHMENTLNFDGPSHMRFIYVIPCDLPWYYPGSCRAFFVFVRREWMEIYHGFIDDIPSNLGLLKSCTSWVAAENHHPVFSNRSPGCFSHWKMTKTTQFVISVWKRWVFHPFPMGCP